MTLYTFGGTPSAVLTTISGDVVPDYPLIVRVAGTGEAITALYELTGNPISELRSNPATSSQPGAIRPFQTEHTEIEYEYLDADGAPIRWYEAGREVASQALAKALDALPRSEGGTVEGHVTAAGGLDVEGGLDVTGGANVDELAVEGNMSVGGVFTPTALSLAGMRLFNPRVYGATGNGATDDAPAVQAALNAAAGAGGGWVIVPPGTYRLATLPIRIYGHTRLTLMPGAVFVRGANQTMLLNGDADQTYGGYSGHGDITIEGGRWEMQATTAGLTASRMCISLGHGERITIRDIEIRDTPGFHAIEVNACKNVRIENCRFLGFVDPGGRDISEAVQIDLATDVGAFGGFGPYDSTPCADIEMRGCYVGASGTAGTTAWPRGIGTHNGRIGLWQRDIRVVGNTFEGCLQYAVVAYNWRDIIVSDNLMRDCGAGVRVRSTDTTKTEHTKLPNGTQTGASQPVSDVAITGNSITGNTGYDDSINIEGEATGRVQAVTISGNVCDTSVDTENGMRIVYASDVAITGNTVTNMSGAAISKEQCIGSTVSGNRVFGGAGAGISANTCSRLKIVGNTVSEVGTVGVWLVGGSVITVESNLITSPSRAASGQYGIRLSTSVADVNIVGNTVRRHGSGNEMAYPLSITSTCTGVKRWGNDLENGTAGILDDQSPNPELSPYDGSGALAEIMRPAGRYETTSRLRAGGDAPTVSGVLNLVPIWLPKGAVVLNIIFVSGNTAGAGLTNQWFALFDRNRVALARTADATTAAWAANTSKSLAIAQTTAGSASSYTATYTGLHYLGVMVAGTTPPSILGEGRLGANATFAPGLGATNSGMTTPPTVTGGAFTAAAFAGNAILAYAYTT